MVAGAVALAAVALAGRNVAPSPWIALVLIVAAAGQVAVGGAMGAYGVRQAGRLARGLALHRVAARTVDETADASSDDGREAEIDEHRRVRVARSSALSQTLLSAVLLSTPSWFVAFAWATGQSAITLLALLATAAFGIAVGTMQIGALARAVTLRER